MPRKPHTHHYIYKTTCKVTGKFYIGMHSTSNLDDNYMGSGMHLWRSIKKYGRENHEKEILEFLPSRKELADREKEIVNENFLENPLCMNIAKGGSYSGGTTGKRFTEESRKRMSQAQKIAQNRTETIEKKIEKLSGQKRSEEAKKKMSDALRGRVLTEEHKKKIGEASSNRSEETRKKMSESRKKWKRSPESIEKGRKTWIEKYSYQIDQFSIDGCFIKRWESLSEIKKSHPSWYGSIIQMLNRPRLKSSRGYIWKKVITH